MHPIASWTAKEAREVKESSKGGSSLLALTPGAAIGITSPTSTKYHSAECAARHGCQRASSHRAKLTQGRRQPGLAQCPHRRQTSKCYAKWLKRLVLLLLLILPWPAKQTRCWQPQPHQSHQPTATTNHPPSRSTQVKNAADCKDWLILRTPDCRTKSATSSGTWLRCGRTKEIGARSGTGGEAHRRSRRAPK